MSYIIDIPSDLYTYPTDRPMYLTGQPTGQTYGQPINLHANPIYYIKGESKVSVLGYLMLLVASWLAILLTFTDFLYNTNQSSSIQLVLLTCCCVCFCIIFNYHMTDRTDDHR